MQLEIKTSKKSFTRHYLELLNGILKLTPRELDSLLLFLEFDQDIACSMQARKHVAQAMSFKSVSVLNNYVKSLKDKKVIYKDDHGVYRYNDIVKPDGNLKSLTFKFVVTPTTVQSTVWSADPWLAVFFWAVNVSRAWGP